MNNVNQGVRIAILFASFTFCCQGQDARQIVEEVQRRNTSKSQRYEGSLEVIDSKSRVSTKRWEFIRIGSFGSSKSVLRFTAPAEVKGVALLVHSHPDRASDQWMWRPAIERDQRIALQDRSTRFFGTDFSYEDLEERDVNQYDFKLVGEDTLDGVACWKVEADPREKKRHVEARNLSNCAVIAPDGRGDERLVRPSSGWGAFR